MSLHRTLLPCIGAAALALLGGCKRPSASQPTPAPAASAPVAAPSAAPATAPAPVATPSAAPAPAAPAVSSGPAGAGAAAAPADAGAAPAGPRILVARESGAVLLWAVNQPGDKAEIFAQRIDEKGALVAAPQPLRRTTGPVRDLAGSARGDTLWTAWLTIQPEGPQERKASDEARAAKRSRGGKARKEGAAAAGTRQKYLVAALRSDLAAGRSDAPVTADNFRAEDELMYGSVIIGARPDGGALLVAPGAPSRCEHDDGDEESHGEAQPCQTATSYEIGPDGKIARKEPSGRIDPGRTPEFMTQVGAGLAYLDVNPAVHVYTEARVVGTAGVPEAMLEPRFADAADMRMAWTGDALIVIGGAAGPDTEESVERIFVGRADGKGGTKLLPGTGTPPPLRGSKLRCVGGRPVVTFSWKGGKVAFDPGRPGASRRVDRLIPGAPSDLDGDLALWVGQVAVSLRPEGLARWRCEGAAMVPAP